MSWDDQAKEVASRSGARICEIMSNDLNRWGGFGCSLTQGDRAKLQSAFKEEIRAFTLEEDPGVKYQVLRIDADEKKKILVGKNGKKTILSALYPGGIVVSVIDDPDNNLPQFRDQFEVIGDYYSQYFP